MKVLCINDEYWGYTYPDGRFPISTPGPKYGDIDEVTDEVVMNDITFYVLAAWPDDAFDARQFIPISEMDETEMSREPIRTFNHWPVDRSIKHLV